MKIIRLKLSNFCQHQNLTLDFSSGIYGIIGPNGAGKSNIIRAIAFALTGYVSDNKVDYLRYGAERGSVFLHVQLDTTGEEVAIERSLQTSDMRLYYVEYKGDKILYHTLSAKPTECKKYLNERMQIDASLIQQVLAVPQEDWGAFFRETPGKRQEMLSKLFSLSFVKARRASFSGIYNTISRAFNDLCARRDTLLEQKRRLGILINSLSEVESYDMNLLNSQHEDYEKTKKMLADKKAVLKMHLYLHKSLEETKVRLLENERDTSEAEMDKPAVSYDPDEIVKLRLIVQSNTAHVERLRVLRRKVADLAKVLGAPKQKVESATIDQCSTELSDLYKQEGAVSSKYDLYIKAYEKQECPTCHNPMHISKEEIDDLHAQREDLKEKVKEKQKEYDELTRKHKEYIGFQSFVSSAIENINDEPTAKSLNILIKAEQLIACDEILNTLDKEIRKSLTYADNVTQAIDKYNERVAQLSDWENRMERLKIEHIELLKRLNDIQSSKEFSVCITETEQELNTQERQLDTQTKDVIDKLTKRSQYDTYVQELSKVEEDLAKLDSVIKPYSGSDGLLAQYKEALDVLSPSELPAKATNAIFKLLLKYINQYLIALNAEFEVYLDDNNDIQCCFSSGLTQPSSRLSGGEKVLLAISLRLAIHTAFTGSDNGGFIVLDEPTTFLDDANREAVKNVLSNIRGSSMFGNFQVIVITHDENLIPLCDTICELEAKE